ncbi:MAG TPA: 5'/3'-nucleotidase SurE [Acidimicrobiales bacterium]|nr:5'/3'-nucleotidase SurE [Acidimicrobiales bacterium]
MRILVTNDDGVRAPGIAALARAAVGTSHDVVIVAPMVDYSGAGAAVGPVHSRDGVDYESYEIEGLEDVPAFGIDGPPALAVILAAVGGFGARPDVVLSGINHGANVGRSALHSGTVGAALTGAHFGLRSLAVSIRWGEDPVPWDTPATIARSLIPGLMATPEGTVLNLNVPDIDISRLRGLRRGRLGRAGTIRSAVHDPPAGAPGGAHPHVTLPPFPSGTLRLDLTPRGQDRELDIETDAGLVANGFACVTPLVGVGEARDGDVDRALADVLVAASAATGLTTHAPGERQVADSG